MKRCSVWILRILFLIVLPGSATAQELGSLEWTRALWEAADSAELPEDTYFEWENEFVVEGTMEDLKRLEKQVGNRVHHPQRRKLEQLRHVLSSGKPLVRTFRLWYGTKDCWRLSTNSFPDIPVEYVDFALNGEGVAWQMLPDRLRLEPANKNVPGFPTDARVDLLRTLWPRWSVGILGSSTPEYTPQAVRRNGTEWSCIYESAKRDRLVELRGDFEPETSSIALRAVNILRSPKDGPLPRLAATFHDHADEISPMGIRLAKTVRIYVDGEHITTYRLVSRRRLEPGELERMVIVPHPDTVDPVRGPVTFTSIHDNAGITSEVSKIRSHEDVRENEPPTDSAERRSLILPIVATSGCVIIVVLVFRKRYAR